VNRLEVSHCCGIADRFTCGDLAVIHGGWHRDDALAIRVFMNCWENSKARLRIHLLVIGIGLAGAHWRGEVVG